MRVLLDANVLLKAALNSPSALKAAARRILVDEDSTCLLNPVSITEILMSTDKELGRYADAGLKFIAA